MRLITIENLKEIIVKVGIEPFMAQTIDALKADFARWHEFNKCPRHATHYPQGVIELMPCSDNELYSFKFVNGHPSNTQKGKMCVTALGLLADVKSGYPLMLSEMTLLTAIRTAATAALGAVYLARKDSHHLALIGTGAQAEFQFIATQSVLPIDTVSFYDPDIKAMEKFAHHIKGKAKLQPCTSVKQAIEQADMIITATAHKGKTSLFKLDDIHSGTHIHGMGGDCPGKTELPVDLLKKSKIIVEYLAQSIIEGEIQNNPDQNVHGELWQLISGDIVGRENNEEITLFDSVGFALEDFSILKFVNKLSLELDIGQQTDLIPTPEDPKDLYGVLF